MDIVIMELIHPGPASSRLSLFFTIMLGIIQRIITYTNKRILLRMYDSLVRQHLEYAVQAWSPHQLHMITYETT